MRMSALTHSLLASLDYPRIAAARKRNFDQLHAFFGKENGLELDGEAVSAPMCYPFLAPRAGFSEYLIRNRIFVPRYWPEVGAHPGQEVEKHLVDHIVPLPCDQRYGDEEMRRLAQAWKDYR
jgi:hypothetical protein